MNQHAQNAAEKIQTQVLAAEVRRLAGYNAKQAGADYIAKLEQQLHASESARKLAVEALNSIANCGQSKVADHWEFRCWVRNIAANAVKQTNEQKHDADEFIKQQFTQPPIATDHAAKEGK